MPAPSLDTAIQSLPPELREMILKRLIAAKIKERKEQGWTAVHEEVKRTGPAMATCLFCGEKQELRTDANTLGQLWIGCEDCDRLHEQGCLGCLRHMEDCACVAE